MGHYDTQFEQHDEDVRKQRKNDLNKRIANATSKMSNSDLEKLVIVTDNWKRITGFMDFVDSMINT